MFQSLRIGTPLYVLHKKEPKIEVGEVMNVGTPQPQYGTTYQSGMQFQMQKMVVDVKVKVGENAIDLQQLPADLTIADFGNNGMVISESKDAILSEVELLRKKSADVIASVDYHKHVLEECEKITADLNPTAMQNAEQKKEIEHLKSEITYIRDDMVDIKGMLTKVLNKKNKED